MKQFFETLRSGFIVLLLGLLAASFVVTASAALLAAIFHPSIVAYIVGAILGVYGLGWFSEYAFKRRG